MSSSPTQGLVQARETRYLGLFLLWLSLLPVDKVTGSTYTWARMKRKRKALGSTRTQEPKARKALVMEPQQRLSHAALNPELDKYRVKVKKTHAKMVTMYTKYEDHGATYYYSVTRGASYEPALDAVSTENQGLTSALKAASTENQRLTSPYGERVGIALCIAGFRLLIMRVTNCGKS
jgi:hypothetical protein